MTQEVSECTEMERHQLRRLSEGEVGLWLLDYQHKHSLSDIEMLQILSAATAAFTRYLARDDEQARTGFRHRLAGE